MKINTIKLQNFRNIPNGIYQFGNRSFIEAKNFTGKTNLLEAIYYAITDYCLDGSSALSVFKPVDNPKAEVSVELDFDNGFNFKKCVIENWVKTRGADEEKLSGHDVIFYVNGIKQKTKKEALNSLKVELGIDKFETESSIDILRALTNPLYLFEQVNHKDLRRFIVDLVGEVTNDDVFNNSMLSTNPLLPKLKERLIIDKYKTDLSIKYYKGLISTQKEEIARLQNAISEEKKVVGVSREELQTAQEQLDLISLELHSLKIGQNNYENSKLKILEEKKQNLKNRLIKQKEADLKIYQDLNNSTENKILENQKKYSSITDSILSIKRELLDLDTNKSITNNKINKNKESIDALDNKINDCRNQWKELNTKVFTDVVNLESIITCPYCGKVVNQELLDKLNAEFELKKLNFEEDKKEQMSQLVYKANILKLEKEKLLKEVDELNVKNAEYDAKKEIIKKGISDFETEANNIKITIHSLKNDILPYSPSQEIVDLEDQLKQLDCEISELDNKENNLDISFKIQELNNKKIEYEKVIKQHDYYRHTQLIIENQMSKIQAINKSKTNDEAMLILIESFLKIKLELQDLKITSSFGSDIKFQLVESNIKEGSWNEVCYPLIKTKIGYVPYDNGSHSEKYITAIKIIEAIKRIQQLPDLPYLIDEAGTFDTETLEKLIITNSQIIAARVNDLYNTPTIITK